MGIGSTRARRLALSFVVFATACFEPQFERTPMCGPDKSCPTGTQCVDGDNVCHLTGCTLSDEALPCVTPDVPNGGTCVAGTCWPPGFADRCGDGVVDRRKESCDDGAAISLSGDGCSAMCVRELDRWTTVDTSIPGRFHHGMAYNSTEHILVVHGGSRDDTWWFDTSWHRSESRGPNSNGTDVGFVYDPQNERFVLKGNLPFNDTWVYAHDTWSRLAAGFGDDTCIALAYDETSHRVIQFGGKAQFGAPLSDTWALDGATWTKLAPANHPGGGCAVATYDPGGQRLVAVASDGTWAWNGTTWSQITATGPVTDPSGAFSIAYDAGHGAVVLATRDNMQRDVLLELVGSTWTTRLVAPDVDIPKIAYDTARGSLVRFGGIVSAEGDQFLLPSLYDLGAVDTAWQKRVLPTYPGIPIGGAVYDRARGVVVGLTSNSETWEFDNTWHRISTSGPPSRTRGMLAYDAERHVTVLFGGSGNVAARNDTWTWDGVTWTERHPQHVPRTRAGAAMAFDEQHRRVVLYGGIDISTPTDDLWTWDGTDWSEWVVPGDKPLEIAFPLLVWAQPEHRFLFVGAGKTLSLDDSGWKPVNDTAPDGRIATYDDKRGAMIVFGQFDSTKHELPMFELLGGVWTPRAPAPVSSLAATIYDPRTASTLFLGGAPGAGATEATTIENALYAVDSSPTETCRSSTEDLDFDGLAGCADPDCWSRCYPMCSPLDLASCDKSRPHCGDGTCSPPLENPAICPTDCP